MLVTVVLCVYCRCGGTSVFGTAHVMSWLVSAFVVLVIYAQATAHVTRVWVGGTGGGAGFVQFMHRVRMWVLRGGGSRCLSLACASGHLSVLYILGLVHVSMPLSQPCLCVGWLSSLAFGDGVGWGGCVGACFFVRRAPGFALELVVQSGLGVTCLCSSCALVGGCVQSHCMCQGSYLCR